LISERKRCRCFGNRSDRGKGALPGLRRRDDVMVPFWTHNHKRREGGWRGICITLQ
jgi:hypothetical protein